jgi:hypothetical protein
LYFAVKVFDPAVNPVIFSPTIPRPLKVLAEETDKESEAATVVAPLTANAILPFADVSYVDTEPK